MNDPGRSLWLGIFARSLLRTVLIHQALALLTFVVLHAAASSLEASALGEALSLRKTLGELPALLRLVAPIGTASAVAVHLGWGAGRALSAAGAGPNAWLKPLGLAAFASMLASGALGELLAPLRPTAEPSQPTVQWFLDHGWLVRAEREGPVDILRVRAGRLEAFGSTSSLPLSKRAVRWVVPPTTGPKTLPKTGWAILDAADQDPSATRWSALIEAARLRARLGQDARAHRFELVARPTRAMTAGLTMLAAGLTVLLFELRIGAALGLGLGLSLAAAGGEILWGLAAVRGALPPEGAPLLLVPPFLGSVSLATVLARVGPGRLGQSP